MAFVKWGGQMPPSAVNTTGWMRWLSMARSVYTRKPISKPRTPCTAIVTPHWNKCCSVSPLDWEHDVKYLNRMIVRASRAPEEVD